MLTTSNPPALLPRLTLADVSRLRDAEWEARELAYHDTAVEELNALVRKYNGLAPYAVRRPYYMRNAELDKAYRDSGEDILRGIAERANPSASTPAYGARDESDLVGKGGSPDASRESEPLRFGDLIREWFTTFRRRT